MRTVHFNQKAAAVAFGSLFLTGLVLFYSVSPKAVEAPAFGHKVLLARDINARSNFELEKLELNQVKDVKENDPAGVARKKGELREEILEPLPEQSIREHKVEVVTAEASREDETRSEFIREMMIHAWNGYKKYAWGQNEVKPISKMHHNQGIFGGGSSTFAATIIDALDTLWIMKLTDQYTEGRDYVEANFKFSDSKATVSLFETNIRFLGGFLAAYALTNDSIYIEKSKEIGDVLLKGFNTETGIPKSTINIATGASSNYGWANGGSSILSEIGTLHLEFEYLSHLTGNPVYREKVQKVRDHLDKIEKIEGLYPNYISPLTGEWTGKHVSLGAMGDSFYEYLLKSYVQTNDTQAWRMYNETIEAVLKIMMQKSKGGLTYIAEWRNGLLEHKMSHLACFCVGMFALQSELEIDPQRKERIMHVAEELGNTCHESYIRSETGIGPEMFYFNDQIEAKTSTGEFGYILRPEVIEGWFYLWRLTGKPVYKEWVWAAVQAIEKYCKKEAGYAGLLNVYNIKEGWDDVQQSFFLAETLKYSYLTFVDKSVFSLKEWVFNTEGHPLPVLTESTK